MNSQTSLKTVFIMPRKLKTAITIILAVLGIILAVIAFGMANDQMAMVNELTDSMANGPVGFVFNAINLLI